MAVEILTDGRRDVFTCTTSDTAFGPILEAGEGEAFLKWLPTWRPQSWAIAKPLIGDGSDPRDYSTDDLSRIVRHWREVTG